MATEQTFIVRSRVKAPMDFLGETEILKNVIMGNFANQGEQRPLNDYLNNMSEFARHFTEMFCAEFDLKFSKEMLEQFEQRYYGKLDGDN